MTTTIRLFVYREVVATTTNKATQVATATSTTSITVMPHENAHKKQ